ncbi:ATP-grasp domain-containing protein [Dermacoccus barathri]
MGFDEGLGGCLKFSRTISRVISFTERSQYAAIALSSLLGLQDHSLSPLPLVRDKRLMKQRLGSAGISVPNFVSVGPRQPGISADEIVERVGLPCVIKPASGMGCFNTRLARSLRDLRAALNDWASNFSSGQLIIEAFQSGDEFHVDALWQDGRPIAFAISKYLVPVLSVSDPRSNNASYVIREDHDPLLYREVESLHRRVNDALGLRRGVTHMEFFRDESSLIVVSEVAARFAGAMIPEAFGYATGFDARMLYVDLLFGSDYTFDAGMGVGSATVGWTTLSPGKSGYLSGTQETLDALALHSSVLECRIVRRDGEFVDPWSNPSQANVIDAVITASSPEGFREVVANLSQSFPIQVKALDLN